MVLEGSEPCPFLDLSRVHWQGPAHAIRPNTKQTEVGFKSDNPYLLILIKVYYIINSHSSLSTPNHLTLSAILTHNMLSQWIPATRGRIYWVDSIFEMQLNPIVVLIREYHYNFKITELTINRGFARKYNDNKLQALEGTLKVAEHGLNLVGPSGVFTETRLSHNRHASVVTDFLQLLREIPKRIFANRPLWSKTCNCPHANFDSHEELFSTHVPYPRNGKSLLLCLIVPVAILFTDRHVRTASVLKLWRRQYAASHFHHVVGNSQSKFLK